MEINKRGIRSVNFIGYCTALFLGALNDNFFKFLLVFFISRQRGAEADPLVIATAGAVFVVPFLLLTPLAGVLADRFSKSRVLQFLKAAEIVIMAMGWVAFKMDNAFLLYGTLALMAAQSALFGPAKYSILPELTNRGELSRANAVVALCTYVAIIAASGMASLSASLTGGHYEFAQIWCIVIAIIGFIAVLPMERTAPLNSNSRASWLIVDDVWRTLRALRGRNYLLGAIYGSAFFSLIGAFMQANTLSYGVDHLNLTQEQSAYLFLFAAGGIGLGSWIAGRLSGRLIEFGIVPIGALGMAFSSILLGIFHSNIIFVAVLMVLAGISGGMFLIPLDAFIQRDAPPERRAEVVAASSFIGWLFILVSQGLVAGNKQMGLDPAGGFFVLGMVTLILSYLAVRVLPDFLTRFVVLVVTRFLCRIKVYGIENVPETGGALLVSNHASYMDAAFLLATQQRRLRFVMSREIYEQWKLIAPFFRILNAIPISGDDPPRRLAASIKAAREAVHEGYLVVIFPEGELTRTGHLRAFRRGFEKIVKGENAPIIPIYLGGAWGSPTSYYSGRLFRNLPRLGRYPINVIFGKPLASNAPAHEVQQAVAELSCDYFQYRKSSRRPLGEELLTALRMCGRKTAMNDTTGRAVSGFGCAIGAAICASAMRRLGPAGTVVGILLPPSVAGAVANLGAQVAGMVPVNLNPTASEEALKSAVAQSGLKHVITSPLLLKRLRVPDLGVEMIDVAAWMAKVSFIKKVAAFFRAIVMPVRWAVHRVKDFNADTVAAILFSSGSTGMPKGIALSHHNIRSNIESLRMVFDVKPGDRLLGALPYFHSFGFTACLWYPVLSNLPVTYHANPLDASGVAKAARENNCTLLFATPTFLSLYTRKIDAADFKSLRFVVTGAERLRPAVADGFKERFGVMPREGYGATELSPVVALGLPDVIGSAVSQLGAKPGSVGLPVPGVAVKVVDPDSGTLLPPGKPGLFMVKGPNVMLKYIGQPELTAKVIQDGWYNTGDMAVIDEDGFVRITDRLSRFSKIGGEMVPHGAVEEAIQQATGKAEQVVAVTGVPDEKRGECLVLFFTAEAGTLEAIRQIISDAALPNLWKPDRDACHQIEALPMLPSGKIDLKKLKEMANGL